MFRSCYDYVFKSYKNDILEGNGSTTEDTAVLSACVLMEGITHMQYYRWKLVSNVMNGEYHKYVYERPSYLQDTVELLKYCQQGMLTTNMTSMP